MSRPICPLSLCWDWNTEPCLSLLGTLGWIPEFLLPPRSRCQGQCDHPTTTTSTVCIRAGCQGQVSPAGAIQTSVEKGRQGRNEEVKSLGSQAPKSEVKPGNC